MGVQLVVSLLTLLALIFGAGRFTSRIEEGLVGVRDDLSEHTQREEKRFDEIRGKLHTQADRLQELTTTQATQHTRLAHLEQGGSRR